MADKDNSPPHKNTGIYVNLMTISLENTLRSKKSDSVAYYVTCSVDI